MRVIQFDTIVAGGAIQIPEQYLKLLPTNVNVTLVPSDKQKRAKFRQKTEDEPLNIDEFPAILDTKGFKFSREEANERR
jgi:hypothetical protein